MTDNKKNNDTAYLAGGCFWCLEAIFQDLQGVVKVTSGYSGGNVKNPTYEQVCTGETGHAEVIKIEYNKDVITYKELLEVFFTTHDPTTLNRQGNDMGSQYRSAVFYQSQEQKNIVEQMIKEIEEKMIWDNSIVTEMSSLKEFYEAEEYHQNYFLNNPTQGYCKVVIEPKVSKFKTKYSEKLKKVNLKL